MLVQSGALKLFIFTDVNFWSPEKVNSVKPLIVVLLISIVSKLDKVANVQLFPPEDSTDTPLISRFFIPVGMSEVYWLRLILLKFKPCISRFSNPELENINDIPPFALSRVKPLISALFRFGVEAKAWSIVIALEVSNWEKSKLLIAELENI